MPWHCSNIYDNVHVGTTIVDNYQLYSNTLEIISPELSGIHVVNGRLSARFFIAGLVTRIIIVV